MVTFEGYERRIEKINATLKEYGIASLEEAKEELGADYDDLEIRLVRIKFLCEVAS